MFLLPCYSEIKSIGFQDNEVQINFDISNCMKQKQGPVSILSYKERMIYSNPDYNSNIYAQTNL